MNLPVLVKPEARGDAAEAARWYHSLSAVLADRFLKAIAVAVDRAGERPTGHPVVDAATGARRVRVAGFPYRVVYLVESDRVVVIAIVHDRRDRRIWHSRIE